MTQYEVPLSALVTSDVCPKKWILNESINKQETRRDCNSQEKVWLPISTQLSKGRIDTFNSFIVGNPK